MDNDFDLTGTNKWSTLPDAWSTITGVWDSFKAYNETGAEGTWQSGRPAGTWGYGLFDTTAADATEGTNRHDISIGVETGSGPFSNDCETGIGGGNFARWDRVAMPGNSGDYIVVSETCLGIAGAGGTRKTLTHKTKLWETYGFYLVDEVEFDNEVLSFSELQTMSNEFKVTGNTLEVGSNFAAQNFVPGDEIDQPVTATDSASPTPQEKIKTFTIT